MRGKTPARGWATSSTAPWWSWKTVAARLAKRCQSWSRGQSKPRPGASFSGACASGRPRPAALWPRASRVMAAADAPQPGGPAPAVFAAPAELGLIVVAAGRGERLGQDKAWVPLGDRPLVAHSLAALARPPVERVVLVVAAGRLAEGRAL